MKPLPILDDLLEQLKSRELSYILIPCYIMTDAKNIAHALGKRNVKWILSSEVVSRYQNHWHAWKENSLYILQRSSITEEFRLRVLHIDDICLYKNTKHAILHPHAIIHS